MSHFTWHFFPPSFMVLLANVSCLWYIGLVLLCVTNNQCFLTFASLLSHISLSCPRLSFSHNRAAKASVSFWRYALGSRWCLTDICNTVFNSQQQSQFYYIAVFFGSSTEPSVTLLLAWQLTQPAKYIHYTPHEVDESCLMLQYVKNVDLFNTNIPDYTETSWIWLFFCIVSAIHILLYIANSRSGQTAF